MTQIIFVKVREIEEGNSLVSHVKSLLSMVIESYSVGFFFLFFSR